MSKESLLPLMAAALLCGALPAWSQELPEGKGKEMVAAFFIAAIRFTRASAADTRPRAGVPLCG